MNDGVKILLERIKTHPEEFMSNGVGLFDSRNRWANIVESYEQYLEPEDRDALRSAMNAVMAERFTEIVMKELMGVEDDDPLGKSQQAQGTVLGGQTQGVSMSHLTHQAFHQQALLAQAKAQQTISNISVTSGGIGLSSGTVTLSKPKWFRRLFK